MIIYSSVIFFYFLYYKIINVCIDDVCFFHFVYLQHAL